MVSSQKKIDAPVGILGGGLAGVTLQHFLKLESEILEKEDRPGGLCRTWKVEGVQSDRGPHIIFSQDKDTLKEMVDILGENVHRLYRRNAIWYQDRLVKYPFENDLHALDPEERFQCLRDFLFNPAARRASHNLEDWAYRTFGPSLARSYFLPYNEKIWKCRASELGTEWVKRIPRPDRDEIIRSAVGVPTEGYRHQLYFYHPIEGGIEALVRVLANERSRIRTSSPVNRIEKVNKIWHISTPSGRRKYEHIVCCLPLPELVKALVPPPPLAVKRAVRRLRVNSLILVLMVYPSSDAPGYFAIYLPKSEILPHRISWVNYLGPHLAPAGYHAVLAEITASPERPDCRLPDEVIAARTIQQLREVSLLPRDISMKSYVHREAYGYVVNNGAYAGNRAVVVDFCRGLGIPLLGRWAEFEYLNMDAVWQRAKRLARELEKKWE